MMVNIKVYLLIMKTVTNMSYLKPGVFTVYRINYTLFIYNILVAKTIFLLVSKPINGRN